MSVATAPTVAGPRIAREEDQRILMHGVTWSEYETLLAVRGDRAGIRIAYLQGDLEITSPSIDHEWITTMVARLTPPSRGACSCRISISSSSPALSTAPA